MARQKSICKIPGCGKYVKAQALCNSHYKRLVRHGDPMAGSTFRASRGKPVQFMEAASLAQTDDCIEWPFAKDKDGYGKVGRSGRAHRMVLEISSGPAPSDNHEAAHAPEVCHNPSCINPRHLRWATVKENSRDRFLDGTDPSGERGGNSKLTEADVTAIRIAFSEGQKIADIARKHAVTYQNVRSIVIGKTWRGLKTGGASYEEATSAEIRGDIPG